MDKAENCAIEVIMLFILCGLFGAAVWLDLKAVELLILGETVRGILAAAGLAGYLFVLYEAVKKHDEM